MLFYTRHHYFQLFRSANKASNGIFSSNYWFNSSTTIFDGQCSKNQQNKNCYNFPIQKLCQRYQFYSTGNEGVNPLPIDDSANSSPLPTDEGSNCSLSADDATNSSSSPNEANDNSKSSLADDSANSSSSLVDESPNFSLTNESVSADDSPNSSPHPLPKIPTNFAMEQKEQHKIRAITLPDDRIFEAYLRWNKINGTTLYLQLQKGKSGRKFFYIQEKSWNIYIHFPNILLPHDAYAFVRAMDELILELAARNFEQKLLDRESNRLLTLRTAEAMGQHHKFQLELLFFPNVGWGNVKPEFCILLMAFNKLHFENNPIPKWLFLPLEALPWLRDHMADMLARHDGTETISKEAPAKIPKKYFL